MAFSGMDVAAQLALLSESLLAKGEKLPSKHQQYRKLFESAERRRNGTVPLAQFSNQLACFMCRTSISEKLRCGRCKGIYYCSKACQVKHWKHGYGSGSLPHKVTCAATAAQMETHSLTPALIAPFPWIELTENGHFPLEMFLVSVDLLGWDKGYWSQESTMHPHGTRGTQV